MDMQSILNDVATYEQSIGQEDFFDLMVSEIGVDVQVFREQIERGRAYYAQQYRVRQTARHLVGVEASDVPSDALAQRRAWAGYIAANEVYRIEYLVKVDERDLISISAAAELLYGENTQNARMRIVDMIRSGKLSEYMDTSIANPQHRRRVYRSELEALKTGGS